MDFQVSLPLISQSANLVNSSPVPPSSFPLPRSDRGNAGEGKQFIDKLFSQKLPSL